MKIGILTFHWATNYGAVLQCYALQEYLKSLGHEVKIINYKPHLFDDNVFTFLRFRKFLHIGDYLNNCKKEAALNDFRSSHLHQTERIYACKDMAYIAKRYDAIVSGSDQVVNPSFLLNGEGKGIVSPTYFLGFPFDGKRIGYALSFGCVTYPEDARKIASNYLKDFDIIGVRENTGIEIAKSMGRDDAIVVPDPTVLQIPDFYHDIADKCTIQESRPYIYSYFIRHLVDRKLSINSLFEKELIIWNNEDGDYTMQGWLGKIKNAAFVITDSFHCVVMCLKFHKPFVVVTEQKGNVGMNDRLYTLLERVGLSDNIVYKGQLKDIDPFSEVSVNWSQADSILSEFHKSVDCLFE